MADEVVTQVRVILTRFSDGRLDSFVEVGSVGDAKEVARDYVNNTPAQ